MSTAPFFLYMTELMRRVCDRPFHYGAHLYQGLIRPLHHQQGPFGYRSLSMVLNALAGLVRCLN